MAKEVTARELGPLNVSGVGRDEGHDCFIVVGLSRSPTDDELRACHEALRSLFTIAEQTGSTPERVAELAPDAFAILQTAYDEAKAGFSPSGETLEQMRRVLQRLKDTERNGNG